MAIIDNSVKSRIRLFFLLLAVLPVLIGLTVFSLYLRARYFEENQLRILNTLQYQKLLIDAWLEDRAQDVTFISQLDFVAAGNLDAMEAFFQDYVHVHDEVYAVVYVTPDGKTAVDQSPRLGIDLSDRTYYKMAMQGKSWISNIVIGRQSGEPIIIFSSPVLGPQGDFNGLIFCPVKVHTLEHMISSYQVDGLSHSRLVDAAGYPLLGGGESPVLPLGKKQPYINDKGQQVIGASVPLDYKNWRLVGEAKVLDVLGNYYLQIGVFSAACLGALALLTPLILRLIHSISGPLIILSHYANAVRYGRPPDACPAPMHGSPVEIQTLRDSICAMVEQLNENMTRLEQLSNTDQLTGLHNRRYLENEGGRLAKICIRGGQPCSCLMIDLDYFKEVNDSHGHAAGDMALKAVAKTILDCCRESDLVARYGGEEFSVIAPNADAEHAFRIADRILTAMRSTSIDIGVESLRLMVSIGVAELSEQLQYGATPLEDMLSKADRALYGAKKQGRNRIVSYKNLE